MKAAALASLPSRERGLKSRFMQEKRESREVAPFAGAWIEMFLSSCDIAEKVSLPSRERGLK